MCHGTFPTAGNESSGALSLTTGSLLLGDLFDVDNSEQWGISASYGDGSFDIIGGTTVGGSYHHHPTVSACAKLISGLDEL